MKFRMRILIVSLLAIMLLAALLRTQIPTNSDLGKSASAPAVTFSASKSASKSKTSTSDLLANWRAILASTEQALLRTGLDDAELADKIAEISSIRSEAHKLGNAFEPVVEYTKEQLSELGAAPKEGELPESEEISRKRQELQGQYSRIDGELKASRLIVVRATQLETKIINKRRHRFVAQISKRSTSVFDIQLWAEFWNGLGGFMHRLNILISDSATVVKTKIENSNMIGLIILAALFLIAYVVVLTRRILQQRLDKNITPNRDDPVAHDQKVLLAGISFVRNGLVPAGGILLLYFLFSTMGILTARLGIFVLEITFVVVAMIISLALSRAYLVPSDPSRRVINLSGQAVAKINGTILMGVTFVAGLRLFGKTAEILVSPFEVSLALSALLALTCIVGFCLVLMAVASDDETAEQSEIENHNIVHWGYLNPLFWIASIGGALSLTAGYIAFAEFLAWQTLIAAMIFALLWLGIEYLDLRRDRYLDAETGRWRKYSRTSGFSKQTVLQGGVFGFGLIKLATIFAALIIFMLSWGFRTGDWAGPVSEAFSGFKIGGLSISFSSIALAIAIFFVGYVVTKAIQRWLRQQFLPTTKLDPGLRNSIATVFGYAGIVLALLLAVSAAGFDLSNVAIIAGALSVGIGFGLQGIVNNFLSGLILLAERPIKSGDWIVTSGGQGTVRKTSVRSTEIETFDGATVIIPNSTLITEAVTNWTHHSQKGRIIVSIGVGYDSDPDQVRDILLECGQFHDRVLKRPAPSVYFQDFGADALIFELRAYMSDINYGLSTKSDLRFAIIRALRAANIEIPYPQRDIHIKSAPDELKYMPAPVKLPKTATKPKRQVRNSINQPSNQSRPGHTKSRQTKSNKAKSTRTR